MTRKRVRLKWRGSQVAEAEHRVALSKWKKTWEKKKPKKHKKPEELYQEKLLTPTMELERQLDRVLLKEP